MPQAAYERQFRPMGDSLRDCRVQHLRIRLTRCRAHTSEPDTGF